MFSKSFWKYVFNEKRGDERLLKIVGGIGMRYFLLKLKNVFLRKLKNKRRDVRYFRQLKENTMIFLPFFLILFYVVSK